MIPKPFTAYFLMKQACLMPIQPHQLHNSFELSVLRLIVTGSAYAACQLKHFIANRHTRPILKRLRAAERLGYGAIGEHVARIRKPYRNSVLGRKIAHHRDRGAKTGRYAGRTLEELRRRECDRSRTRLLICFWSGSPG
ncbi:protein of unknown function [Burkholderia multivorans]